MSTEWHLIQFTSDLKRKEPRNIGVVAGSDGQWELRLVGADYSGSVTTGARRFGLPKSAYAPWVAYYTRMVRAGRIADVLVSQRHRPTEFRLVSGGVIMGQQEVSDVVDSLFGELVDTEAKKPAEDRAKVLRRNVEKALELANIVPIPEVEVHARWGIGDDEASEYDDDVRFDYSYTNGQVHLMDRLQLHQPSVEQARILARDFNARVSGVRATGVAQSFVAFYSGAALDGLGDAVLAPVWRVAHSIDVDRPGRAAGELSSIMQPA